MAIHFLSLKLVLASVDLRKITNLIKFIFRGFLWSFKFSYQWCLKRISFNVSHNDYLEKIVKVMCRAIKEEEQAALIFNLTNKI